MRDYDWSVEFEGGHGVCVRATSKDEALILAKARRIKSGLKWRNVVSAECMETSNTEIHRKKNYLA